MFMINQIYLMCAQIFEVMFEIYQSFVQHLNRDYLITRCSCIKYMDWNGPNKTAKEKNINKESNMSIS